MRFFEEARHMEEPRDIPEAPEQMYNGEFLGPHTDAVDQVADEAVEERDEEMMQRGDK